MSTNTRTIHTGFYTNKAKEVIDSVFGQLSDGMWENSRAAEKYWRFATTDVADDGEIVVNISTDSRKGYDRDWVRNGFYDMTEKQVLEFIAHKMKAVAIQELKDEGIVRGWKHNNETVRTYYLSYEEPVTIADVYYIYDALLGCKSKSERPDLVGAKRNAADTAKAKAKKIQRKEIEDNYTTMLKKLDEEKKIALAELEKQFNAKREEIYKKYRDDLANVA